MGLLAIDIETASPFNEPQNQEDFQDTDYFELVAIALGYRPSEDSDTETAVLFRQGDWEPEATAELLDRLVSWCDQREINRTLTYNGQGFDEIHLRNWAAETDEKGLHSGLENDIDRLFAEHRDLAISAGHHHGDRLDYRDFPKFEDLCRWEGIEASPTLYTSYDLNDDLLAHPEITGEQVEGTHIGVVLGEKYVEWVAAGLHSTRAFQELQRLIEDYAAADVRPLFELHETLPPTDAEP